MLKIYEDLYEISFNDKTLELTPKEYELLKILIKESNKLLSKSSIINGQRVSLILNKLYLEIKKNKKRNYNLNLIKKSIFKYVDKIDYFEIRNKFTLKRKFNNKNFKIFISYYLNKVRIIDNY